MNGVAPPPFAPRYFAAPLVLCPSCSKLLCSGPRKSSRSRDSHVRFRDEPQRAGTWPNAKVENNQCLSLTLDVARRLP